MLLEGSFFQCPLLNNCSTALLCRDSADIRHDRRVPPAVFSQRVWDSPIAAARINDHLPVASRLATADGDVLALFLTRHFTGRHAGLRLGKPPLRVWITLGHDIPFTTVPSILCFVLLLRAGSGALALSVAPPHSLV
jgi:hypothetical protein